MNFEKIRKSVSKAYAKAISGSALSCCGPKNSCCGPNDQAGAGHGAVADLAGYSPAEMAASPDAATSSFGCGNPLAFSEVKAGDVVLDLGAGAGFDLLIASEKVGDSGRVIGIDMTDEMLEAARRNIAAANATNVEVRKGLIEDMPVESASVDWVISNCVINLSPEKKRVFAEISRVLKPGGRMLVSDIVVDELPDEIRQIEALYNSCVAGAISEEEYLAGLQEAGLEDVSVESRLVYETSQVRSFFESDEVPDLKNIFDDLPAAERQKAIDRLLAQISGKVWSAKFSARKPLNS